MNEVKTNQSPHKHYKRSHIAGVVLLCFVASFMGSWVFVASGLVKPDATSTITENRETLVLQEGEIVAEVFEKVSPSTVAVIGQAATTSNFFGNQTQEFPGSGIIISADGYVLTNKHVVPEGVSRARVVLHDGTQFDNVEVVGRDPFNDIAFLKINDANNLTPAAIGDSSQIKPGQKVVAIGNALGEYQNSVTTGIISGMGRPVEAIDSTGTTEKLENLLQTDAAINPGNSGGPLVNLKGEVIGVNTAKSNEGEAISFAIPINDIKGMIESVLEQGRIVKAYLGVRYVILDPEISKQLGLSVSEGAVILGGGGQPGVMPGSPANKADLRSGDIIAQIDGQKITAQSGLASKLAQFSPGDKIDLTIIRDGQEQHVNVTLEEYRQ